MDTHEATDGPYLKITDDLLRLTFLRIIPRSISPNAITIVRFICVPIVVVLLLSQNYAWAAVVFAFAAFTDALDGAMARTRGQITPWGKVADPFADKLLIGATALILVTRYMNLWLTVAVVGIEIVFSLRATYRYMTGHNASPNVLSKTKMVLQSFALIALFAYVLAGSVVYLLIATWLLYAAILFALASFLSPSSV
jgi:CDP-diacylglycerol--glycerol-3-phosphate 3-phosphatidyltransferase